MVVFGNTDTETPELPMDTRTMDYASMKPRPYTLTHRQADHLKMSFVTSSFMLGFPICPKSQSMKLERYWVKSSTHLNNTLPNLDEDEPWYDEEKEEEYK